MHIQVESEIANCIGQETVHLKIGNELKIVEKLGSLLRVGNIFELPFAILSSQDCNVEVSLVSDNGKVDDTINVDCGKLFVSAQIQFVWSINADDWKYP